MLKLAVSVAAFVLVTPSAAPSQPTASTDHQYQLLVVKSSRWRPINISKVSDRLREAEEKGFTLHLMATSSRSLNMLLKHATTPSAGLRLIATSSERSLVDELNKAGAQGLRVVPEGIKAFDETIMGSIATTWIAALARHQDAHRVSYSLVKGRTEAAAALNDSSVPGRVLVGAIGRQGMTAASIVVFLEATEGTVGDAPRFHSAEYRVVSAARTSAMQTDLAAAAAEGFRVVMAGPAYMTAVVAKAPGTAPQPVEYRLLAAQRVATSARELQAAGAEGFRLVATSEHGPEAIFILERTPGRPERFRYEIVELSEANVNATLVDAESKGFRVVRLIDELAVFEGPLQ